MKRDRAGERCSAARAASPGPRNRPRSWLTPREADVPRRKVAVSLPARNRWFFATALRSAQAVLQGAGCEVVLLSSSVLGSPGRDVDGMLVLGVSGESHEVRVLQAAGVPVTAVSGTVRGGSSVGIDDVSAARLAVGHLLDLGHTQIAFVGGDPADPLHNEPAADRRDGWRSSLHSAGIVPRPEFDEIGGYTVAGGAAAMARLLALPDRPTAVFAASDEMAFGAIDVARRADVRVPHDVSVVGVDDHEMAELFELTTIRQSVGLQVATAAGLLLTAMTEHTGEPIDVLTPTSLVTRSSTWPR